MRKQVGRRNAYSGGGAGEIAFGLADIRPSPQQVERQARVDLGR